MSTSSDQTGAAAAGEAQDPRLDRQVRIPGWDQEGLARARVGVAGDDPWLTGLFVAAAAALGLNRLTVVAPELEPRLLTAARGLHPELELAFFPGHFSHFLLEDLFAGCDLLVDLGHHALATKLLLNLARSQDLPLVRSYGYEEEGAAGVRLFTYRRGREWGDLLQVLPPRQLPAVHRGDPALALVIAGLALEETKKLLLGEPVTPEVASYLGAGAPGAPGFPGDPGDQGAPLYPGPLSSPAREHGGPPQEILTSGQIAPLAVVGAGALGNFVGLGLAALGFSRLTFFDPDPVEITNLNRQILFWDAVGKPKAQTLAERLREWFGVTAAAEPALVTRNTDLSAFLGVFDCTDNFESRIILSEACRRGRQVLISGGTGVSAGQAVLYDPARDGPTPAELLGLYDIVGRREAQVPERQRASCLYAPEPAVIMTNQIIGGLMVDLFRRWAAGEAPPNLFYDALGERLI
ncbi:MAG: hypothetical protein FJ128_11690 [Deltaproteobacteria bacterium]|nr:hypothetical protein [Deltaproteobacteria bacterium]